ncbi:putative anti-sigma factor antagonist [Nocardioides psychrotolerans]|nr:putative anti-sigma factor antagonist [Nocardioides psychrotolerans]
MTVEQEIAAAPGVPGVVVVVEQHGNHQLALVSGEVDMASVSALRMQLRDLIVDGSSHVLVDLSAVSFMDSAGLAALVATRKHARVLQGSFGLIAPSKQVGRLLSLTAMDKVFPCFDSLGEALAAGSEANV